MPSIQPTRMLGFITAIAIYSLLSSDRFWDLVYKLLNVPVPPRDDTPHEEDGPPHFEPTPPQEAPTTPYSTHPTHKHEHDESVLEWDVINHKPQKP